MNSTHRNAKRLAAVLLGAGLSACNQSSTTVAPPPPPPVGIAQLASVATNDISKDAQLQNVAMTEGKALYEMHCSACHGMDLKGVPDKHTPDLTDNNWMYVGDDLDTGGVTHTAADVEKTILLGIRAMPKITNLGSQQENDAKNSEIKNLADMPAFSPKGEFPLSDREIADVAEYVLQLGGQNRNAQAARRGKVVFENKGSCYDCHEQEGTGDPAIGSTNLTTPPLYLYGSTRDAILASLKTGRAGVSPAFQGMLKPEEAKAIAVYVFSQGGSGAP